MFHHADGFVFWIGPDMGRMAHFWGCRAHIATFRVKSPTENGRSRVG
jgi:hypothetical protein